MGYQRVIPRDLFNESSLLKCYGQLYLNLERMNVDTALIESSEDSLCDGFRISQSEMDGSLTIDNVHLVSGGEVVRLFRPLNSRGRYSLYLVNDEDE